MAKRNNDRQTLRAGDINEPLSIVRDDYSKPTFAETEMKLQGTKAYEYNARKTLSRATTAKKEEYKDKTGHHFVWYKQIYLPILKLKPKNKKFTGKSKKKDHSIAAVLLTVFVIAMVGYIVSNWDSIRPMLISKSDNISSELIFHEQADNDYDSGAECVGAFLAYVAEGDAPNAMRCLDSYAGFSYFGCESRAIEYENTTGNSQGHMARMLLKDLVGAYDDGSQFVNLRADIDEYSFRATPALWEGRHIIRVQMELETVDGYQQINLKIPTATLNGNYYIAYEAIN